MPKDDFTRLGSTGNQKSSEGSDSIPNLDQFESIDLDLSARSTNTAGPTESERPACPYRAGDMIGKYQVVSELGTGGFGHVLLCRDPKLLRMVAIKFPRIDRQNFSSDQFLEEGRSVARLDHPSIVKVYNIEETEDGLPFAVMEYVEGPTLHQVVNDEGLKFSIAIKLLVQLAEALEYAHSLTVIHRDLKPSNVIITVDRDRAKLMDFGMALHDMTPEENLSDIPEGTPPYMAPEQIRGENHRLDRRTDIWGFGAMMYVMLTGQRPFSGKNLKDLASKICLSDPVTPKRANPEVPKELERICLKCLEKLMSARYDSATELIEDLKMFDSIWDSTFLQSGGYDMSGVLPLAARPTSNEPQSGTVRGNSRMSASISAQKVKVVPKGLRSFDAQDAEFFLDLLPGPKDRFGMPDSLRFWLNKLSEQSIEPLTVGLIFGPSGCGKSSMVKAGLLPRLPAEYKTIYLEATPHDTEQDLLDKIGQLAPDVVKGDPGISVALSRVRRGHLNQGQKLLIVIDQFEQWLQAHSDLIDQPLVEALRHCDGENLSCILLVRDDFWMSATRFMSQLDMKVQEGVNALGIPLFDKRHARKVLTAYGQASEALPEVLTADQQKFVAATVDEISDHDQIIPIHLALFTQMMDSDSWQSSRLKQLGGWQGLGVQFLEKISTDKRVSRYDETLRSVLTSLLPPPTSEIKGTQKSFSDLSKAAGVENKPDELRTVMEYLDRDVRIVGSTETDGDDKKQPHYQLTHDFLVAPIRKWITLKEKETWQGRANIRLSELSRQWETQHDSRFLPGLFEYVPMLFGVDRKSATDTGRAFLNNATRFYGIRAAILFAALLSLGFAGRYFLGQTNSRIVQVKIDSLLAAPPAEVNARLENLEPYDANVVRAKIDAALQNPLSEQAGLHALLARARFSTVDKVPVPDLVNAIELADKGECGNILKALERVVGTDRQSELHTALTTGFGSAETEVHKIRLSIVSLFLGDPNPASVVLQPGEDPELRERFIEVYPEWHGETKKACELIRQTSNPRLVCALLKSIGQLPDGEIDAETRNLLLGVVNKKIRSATEPVVFSTCQWLLQKFGTQLPSDFTRASNGNWFIKRFDNHPPLVFLRVDPQTVPGRKYGMTVADQVAESGDWRIEDENLKSGFYMASTEVSASLFYEFLESDFGTEDEASVRESARRFFLDKSEMAEMSKLAQTLDKGLPIYSITWDQAIVFCNWLSNRDDLEPVYESYMDGESRFWRPVDATNGYRLPTGLQWDASNRTGTRTRFFFGQFAKERLRKYAVTAFDTFAYPGIQVGATGQKMPNDYGFFDLLGNASEWCEDGTDPEDLFGYHRPLRGGDAQTSNLTWYASGTYFNNPATFLNEGAGIRLVLPIAD